MANLLENNFNEVLESSVSLSTQAIYWLHKDGRLLFANDNALNVLGYTLVELQNLMLWDVDANVNTKEKYFEAIAGFEVNGPDGQPNVIESSHKRKNGEVFPVEIISKLKTIDGVEYVISYAKDITERLKRTEDINFYFELIDSSKDMIFLVEHSSGKIEFVNQTVCDSLGYSLEEIRKMKVSDFRKPFEEIDNIELPEVFKRIQKENNMITFGIYQSKTGKEIPVETSVHFKKYHEKSYVVAISRDITERIEVEHKKEELNKKLTDYNETLKLEIEKAKKELIDYQNIMRRQSRMAAMGEMIENIAHQWRQPLSAVSMLSTGMILQSEQEILDKENLSTGLLNINEQMQYLSKTIDDFRNFFKPEKEKNRFRITDLINNTIKLTNARYGIDINFIKVIEDHELNTYENELLQVVLNILSNAIDELSKVDYKKYIFIETFIDKFYLTLKIKDNAGGIDELILERIFEPYFTTKHKYQGTGIGLYMSENIVKHMQGEIIAKNVDIEYNNSHFKGACFEIKIPLDIKKDENE